jgi:hypothetical protein
MSDLGFIECPKEFVTSEEKLLTKEEVRPTVAEQNLACSPLAFDDQ